MRFAKILGGLGLVGLLYTGCVAKTPVESSVSALENQAAPVQQQLTEEEAAKLLGINDNEIDLYLSSKGGVFYSYKGGENSDANRLFAITGAEDGKVEVVIYDGSDGKKYCGLKGRYDLFDLTQPKEENQRRLDLFINTLRKASGYDDVDNVVTHKETEAHQAKVCQEEYKKQQKVKEEQEVKQAPEIKEESLTK